MHKSVAGIIRQDKKILLGKRKPGGSIGGKWEFPGGKVKKDEDFEKALIREFYEELEVNIKVGEFITSKEFSGKDHYFSLYAYNVHLLEDNIKHNEHEEFKWMTIDEIRSLGENLADSDRLLLDSL